MERQQQLNIIPIKFGLVSEKLLSNLNRFFDRFVQEPYQFDQTQNYTIKLEMQ